MALGISNIAWSRAEDEAVAEFLANSPLTLVEIAPTSISPDLVATPEQTWADCRAYWNTRGLQISSLQALLFGKPELTIFESEERRNATRDYLGVVFRIAQILGAGPLVFGSPKNRRTPDDMPADAAMEIAVDFFNQLGDLAETHGVTVCLEPNPPEYGANFAHTVDFAGEVVTAVNHPRIRLMLDMGGMQISGDDIDAVVRKYGASIAHFHASNPFLKECTDLTPHRIAAAALKAVGYQGDVVLEMGRQESGIDAVRTAVGGLVECYSGLV